jgi:hypothetical protein
MGEHPSDDPDQCDGRAKERGAASALIDIPEKIPLAIASGEYPGTEEKA